MKSTTKTDWSHNAQFIGGTDAVRLYRRMLNAPWSQPDAEKSSACYFGLSYTQTAGGRSDEHPNIPDFLKALAERVALHTKMPVNYVQCRRMAVGGRVNPHNDPSGMIVPMLTVGAERTFRVGGDYTTRNISQVQRPVESHSPEAEYLLKAGDLLVFNGGRVVHSMFPAARDAKFKPNGCDYRISILFRYTTAVMRTLGSRRKYWTPAQIQQHETEYRSVQDCFLAEHQAQPSLFSEIGERLKPALIGEKS